MTTTAKKPLTRDEALFATMRDGRWYRASTLVSRVSHRFGAYIHDLRELGFEIEAKRERGDREWKYRMTYIPTCYSGVKASDMRKVA